MVGRGEELDALRAAFARALDGELAVVVIDGEAGIGKSRLVAEFAASKDAGDMHMLSGTCLEMTEGALPFAPFIEALRGLFREANETELVGLLATGRAELSRLFPELGERGDVPSPSDAGSRTRLFEVILGVVARLARSTPVVLVVEDLHWADQSTRDLLAFLVRHLRREAVMVVVTIRPDAFGEHHPLLPFLVDLERDSHLERLSLQTLDRHDLARQLADILGQAPEGSLIEEIFRLSGGNPFFVEELIVASHRAGSRELPGNLRGLVASRLARLSTNARVVLRVIAVAGRRATDELIGDVAGLPEFDLYAALHEAIDSQIVARPEDEGEGYQFRHGLLGEAILANLLPGERRRMHGLIATALEADPALPAMDAASRTAELAYHWLGAGRLGEALGASIEAAENALGMVAFAEAEAHFARALELWPRVPDAATRAGLDRTELVERAAHAAFRAGSAGRAVELIKDAVADLGADAEPVRAGHLQQRLGSYLSATNDDDAALEAMKRAVELVPAEPPTPLRARVLASLGATLMLAGQFGASLVTCKAALDVARTVGALDLESQALNFAGVDMVSLGRVDEGLASLHSSLHLAQEGGSPITLLEAYNNLASMLARSDRLSDAVRYALEGIGQADAFGLKRSTGTILRSTAASAMFQLGRWKDAEQIVSEALELGPQGEQAIYLANEHARLAVAQGRFAEADRDLETARTLAAPARRTGSLPALFATLAELEIWRGRLDAARESIAQGLGHLATTEDSLAIGQLCAIGIRCEADRAEADRARRITIDNDDAHRVAKLLLERARGIGRGFTPSTQESLMSAGALHQCEAEWTRLVGTPDPSLWAASADNWERAGVVYSAAYSRTREAEARLALKESRDSVAAILRGAYATTQELGAAPLLAHIVDLARRSRIDLDVVAPEDGRSPVAGRQTAAKALGLTAREAEVLALVCAGDTNRQIAETLFISEKTASVHMTNILAKLGVTSRFDAAAIAKRAGLDELPSERVDDRPGRPARSMRTFLLAEMTSSARLVESIGVGDWNELRRWYHETLRSQAAQFGGGEIEDVDDGLLVAFSDAGEAIRCAAAIQHNLAAHRREHGFAPSVRIAIHQAEATRAGGAYVGRGVHETVRIASVAEGGEIVADVDSVPATMQDVVGEPRSVKIKGLVEPIRLVRIDWGGARVARLRVTD